MDKKQQEHIEKDQMIPSNRTEVKNAHAAGDGAIEKNDENLEFTEKENEEESAY